MALCLATPQKQHGEPAVALTPPKQLMPLKTPDNVCTCCSTKTCDSCRFQAWCAEHPDVVSIGGGGCRWLDLDPENGTIFCRVCNSFGSVQFTTRVAFRNLAHTAKRHAGCAVHQAAVQKCMGLVGGGMTPPTEHFVDVWDAACKGDRAAAGLAHTGKRERTDKMLWCIHEAIRLNDQDVLRRADVITLVRDARKGRLLVRFIAVAGLDRHSGILGQAKMFGTTAADVTRATLDMIHKFCQLVGDLPRNRLDKAHGPAVDLQLEAHILNHIEAHPLHVPSNHHRD